MKHFNAVMHGILLLCVLLLGINLGQDLATPPPCEHSVIVDVPIILIVDNRDPSVPVWVRMQMSASPVSPIWREYGYPKTGTWIQLENASLRWDSAYGIRNGAVFPSYYIIEVQNGEWRCMAYFKWTIPDNGTYIPVNLSWCPSYRI